MCIVLIIAKMYVFLQTDNDFYILNFELLKPLVLPCLTNNPSEWIFVISRKQYPNECFERTNNECKITYSYMNLHTEPFSLTMCSQILGDISFSGSSRGNKLSRLSFIFCEHSFGCSERSLTRRRCFHDIIPVSSVEDRHFVTLLACFVPTIIT